MSSTGTRRIALGAGVISVLALALIHLWIAPMHLVEKPYIGVLFIAASVLLVTAAAGLCIRRLRLASWWFGALVCFGMAIGYVLSRTTGLPDGYHESWNDGYGTACLLLEAAYAGAFAVYLLSTRRRPAPAPDPYPVAAAGRDRARLSR